MLSNTATPRYYGAFRDAVLRGEIPVCEQVAMEMSRIDDLIADPDTYYDDQAVEGWIRYCEGELTLTDGSTFKMLDSFKLWGEQIFGWYRFIEKPVFVPSESGYGPGHFETRRYRRRLTRKQFLIVGRGAAKSLYDSFIQSYFQNIDFGATQGITVAPTMAQAEEVMAPLRTAISIAHGPYFKFMTAGSLQNTTGSKMDRQKLASTKKGIQNFLNNSIIEVRAMSIAKLQGLRCKIATVDEWLSCDTREDVIGALEQGASKLKNYIIVATSSEGTVRNGVGDTIKLELMAILKREYKADHVSIWWYKLDSVEEVGKPEMWLKANPNLGKTVTYEVYQQDVERAEHSPSARNDILAKRFGLPMEGYTYFFAYEDTIPHEHHNFDGCVCAMGVDLSQGDDFCSFTFLFPQGRDIFGAKTVNFITATTLAKLPGALFEKYQHFIAEGTLIVMEGTVLDMLQVEEVLGNFIEEHQYEVCAMGYDPYNAKDFVERWCIENGSYGVEKVIQGAKTESVPLGEIKKLMEERHIIFDEELMSFALGNCITIEDTNGNRKLSKVKREQKIDSVAALMDAYIAYKLNRGAFE